MTTILIFGLKSLVIATKARFIKIYKEAVRIELFLFSIMYFKQQTVTTHLSPKSRNTL